MSDEKKQRVARSESEDESEKTLEISPDGQFYKINQVVGKGAFKIVHRGLNAETGVPVAWCELQSNHVKDDARKEFVKEATLLKTLEHPNIVRFYDAWEVTKETNQNKTEDVSSDNVELRVGRRPRIVIITELVTSGTLRNYVKRFKSTPESLSTRVIKSWCRQIISALHFLHSRTPPIIHRDLKCDNIFIYGTNGSIKIGDMGLAKLKTREYATSVIGTPEFMAPEMYDEKYDESVDVYAFGMCLLELLTYEYPYEECQGPAQIFRKVTEGVRPACFEKLKHPGFRDIIDWCTKLKTEDRPTTKQLLEDKFFDDYGFSLEFLNRKTLIEDVKETVALFRLKFIDNRKSVRPTISRRISRSGSDSIGKGDTMEITCDIGCDEINNINKILPHLGKLENEEDRNTVAEVIEHHIAKLLEERTKVHPNHCDNTPNKKFAVTTVPTHYNDGDMPQENSKDLKRLVVTENIALSAGKSDRFTVTQPITPESGSMPRREVTETPSENDNEVFHTLANMGSTSVADEQTSRNTVTEPVSIESAAKTSLLQKQISMASLDNKLTNIFSPGNSPPKSSPLSPLATSNSQEFQRDEIDSGFIETSNVRPGQNIRQDLELHKISDNVISNSSIQITNESQVEPSTLSNQAPLQVTNDPSILQVNIPEDNSTQILNEIQRLDDEHKRAIIEHNRIATEMQQNYQLRRAQLKTRLFEELRIQEIEGGISLSHNTQPQRNTHASPANPSQQISQMPVTLVDQRNVAYIPPSFGNQSNQQSGTATEHINHMQIHSQNPQYSMVQQLQNTNVISYAEMPVQQMPQIPIPQLNPPNLVQVSGNSSVIATTLQSSIAPNTHMIHNQIHQSTPQSPIRVKEEEGVFIMESQTQ